MANFGPADHQQHPATAHLLKPEPQMFLPLMYGLLPQPTPLHWACSVPLATPQNLVLALQAVQLHQRQPPSFSPFLPQLPHTPKPLQSDLLGPTPLFPAAQLNQLGPCDLVPPVLEPQLPYIDCPKEFNYESAPPLLEPAPILNPALDDPVNHYNLIEDQPPALVMEQTIPDIYEQQVLMESERATEDDKVYKVQPSISHETSTTETCPPANYQSCTPSDECKMETDKEVSNENESFDSGIGFSETMPDLHNESTSRTEVSDASLCSTDMDQPVKDVVKDEPDHLDTIVSPPISPLTPLQNIQVQKKPPKLSRACLKRARPIPRLRKRKKTLNSNWRPIGEGQVVDVRLYSDVQSHKRLCYPEIRHKNDADEVVRVRDCVRVCSAEGFENIGKIVRIFLEERTGELLAQVLWYYTQSQVPKEVQLHPRELLASKHSDVINVDAIEEHAFVLSFSEYSRFIAETRIDEMPPEQRPLEKREIWPRGEEKYPRRLRLPHEDTPMDLIFFCRHVFSVKTRKICQSVVSRRGSLKGQRRNPR